MKVAFIGLGMIGNRMASLLATHNVDLTVFNKAKAPYDALGFRNVSVAESLHGAVKDADLVISKLSGSVDIEETFFGKKGALESMKENAIWVDTSTVNPSFSTRAYNEAELKNVRFLDAPVIGSNPETEAEEFVFFVNEDREVINREVEPYLNMIGDNIIYV